ncbi:MAG: cell division protein FtsB [Gammaproteobacteria bacterium]|nr:cell division protein FtsB [Gammaproteobacteria bacterium]
MRLLIALLAAALVVLQFRLWLTEGGLREVWRLKEQVALRTEENRLLAERNAALEAEVLDLKRGLAAAEERARSELGMVLPDESFFQIVDSSAMDGVVEMPRADAPTADALTADGPAVAVPPAP